MSALGAPVAAHFSRIEEAYAAELDTLVFRADDAGSVQSLRDRYMLDEEVLYLNHASIGTLPRAVHEARQRYLTLCESNPWLYMWGDTWEPGRESARAGVAAILGASPEEVALTHNTTEGFNVLAHGLSLGPGDEVLFSSLNHDGASVCWRHMAEVRGFQVRSFSFPVGDVPGLSDDDVVDIHMAEVRDETKVLVFPHVDNMVGLRHPLGSLASEAHRRGIEFVASDGAQSAGMLPLALAETEIDFYAASPHKWIQAPKGLGALYVRSATLDRLRPMWVTWGQQRWRGTVRVFEDYGTRNLPETLALGDAADFQRTLGADEKQRRLQRIWRQMKDRVDAAPSLGWRSPLAWESGASLVAIEVAGRSANELAIELYRDHGVVVRAFQNADLNALRVSPNVLTTDAEIDRFFDLLEMKATS